MAEGEYRKLYDFGRLFQAEKRAAKCKRAKREIVNFELNLGNNICRLSEQLKNRTYRMNGYYKFTVFEPKRREIQALHFQDRVVQNCFCNEILHPYFEKRLIFDGAACRVNKGSHFAVSCLTGFMQSYYKEHGYSGYVLKADVRKYFNSIDHDVLKKCLRKYPDAEVRSFIGSIIDSYEKTPGKGLPMGNQSSQWFALYYMDGLDRLIKEKLHVKYYSRYMDDLVLIHQDKAFLRKCLAVMSEYAKDELKLEFNEKTGIFPLRQGVEYLGFRFYLTETGKVVRRLRSSSKRRFKRRLRWLKRGYQEGLVSLERVKQTLSSYNGHLSHGHTWRLRENVFEKITFSRTEETENRIAEVQQALLGEYPAI